MNSLIGIDAGGTKTSGILYDLEGIELRHAVTGAGNIASMGTTAIENVAKCITELNPDGEPVALLVLGMAGVTAAGKVDEVRNAIAAQFPQIAQIKVLNDAQLGIVAALQGKDGIFVIAGTGSIVMASASHKFARVGGMGHILGDEGSGYWIGKQLFMRLASDYNRDAYSNLSKRLLVKENTAPEDTPKIAGKYCALTKDEVAHYALFVTEQCQLGDEDACAILIAAGEELAAQVRLAAAKLGNSVRRVATSGSVITKNKVVRDAFLRSLPEFEVLSNEFTPEKAVYYLYQTIRHEP